MSVISVGTPFNIDLEFATAPLLRRIGAVLLDMLILVLYMLVVYRLFILHFDIGQKLNQLTMTLGISILPFFYFPVTEILMNGQTPGKRLAGIKVMDKEGLEPTISQYLLRWLLGLGNYAVFSLPYLVQGTAMSVPSLLLYSIFILGVFYLPAFLSCAFTQKSQRIADIAAGTVVIDLRKKMSFTDTIYQEINGEHTEAKYPQVLQLSDKDINRIKDLLHQKSTKKADREYLSLISERIRKAIHIDAVDEDDTAFLAQLLQDYNYLTQKRN